MKIALAQFKADQDKALNQAKAVEHIARAAQGGADLIVLPEAFMAFIPSGSPRHHGAIAETLEGPFVSALSEAARAAGIFVVCGMYECHPSDPVRAWNTSILLDRQGHLLHHYHKTHLYDAFSYLESRNIIPGVEAPSVVDTELGRIGLLVCYELRFPEVARELALQGADLLVVPTAWVSGPLKEDHFQTLVKARALENTLPVCACSQTGNIYIGRSLICDAMGTVRASMGAEEDIIFAEIDPEHTRKIREVLPCINHRRPELYGHLVG